MKGPEREYNAEGQVAILDQFHDESPEFTKETVQLFEKKNIQVDVYENITVDLYRQLPTLGYKVVILRIHSAIGHRRLRIQSENGDIKEVEVENNTLLFTTEEYESSKYPVLQTKNLVGAATVRKENVQRGMFAITPKFVKTEMKGDFKDTLVITDSCNIFNPKTNYKLTQAFYEKNVEAMVSWKGNVTLNHGDKGTLRFLKHIYLHNMPLGKATEKVLEEIGKDPKHGAKLMVSEKGSNLRLVANGGKLFLKK